MTLTPCLNSRLNLFVFQIFQGTRNTGKSVKGKNVANPLAMFNASADLLEYLGLHEQCQLVRSAIDKAINEVGLHTPDMGGTASTTDVVDFIRDDVKRASVELQ